MKISRLIVEHFEQWELCLQLLTFRILLPTFGKVVIFVVYEWWWHQQKRKLFFGNRQKEAFIHKMFGYTDVYGMLVCGIMEHSFTIAIAFICHSRSLLEARDE